jgi:hypothetical protein
MARSEKMAWARLLDWPAHPAQCRSENMSEWVIDDETAPCLLAFLLIDARPLDKAPHDALRMAIWLSSVFP